MRTLSLILSLLGPSDLIAASKPNVIVILTDDQGNGDLSKHGNPVLKTPNIDRIADTGVRLTSFHNAPVCAPTRASLLTGRYYYRTGVVDTFIGRAMMHPDETTLAESLGKAGYRTGLVGKWHLGDSYPLRPQDQGFGEVLMHKGGGIAQPSDPPGGNSYTDPFLEHNGKTVQKKGYVTDVFTDAALDFVSKDGGPFFLWLAYNAPHGPLQVPEKYLPEFQKANLDPANFPNVGYPWKNSQPGPTQRVYAMVKNIDENVGRLLAKLDEKKLRENTIVVFMTDNGPQQERYRMGFRDNKGSVFEGGIRVPFFLSWPASIPAGHEVATPAAHIDLLPTLLDLCSVERGEGLPLDGRSLAPLMRKTETKWPDRVLFSQWHRGEVPEKGRAFAAIGPRWKLVQPAGVGEGSKIDNAALQLYDLLADPYEQHDKAKDQPAEVAALKKAYEAWFDDVKKDRSFLPPRIGIGSEKEPTTMLTRQDWRGPKAGWTPMSLGHWEVDIAKAGAYRVKLWFAATKEEELVTFQVGTAKVEKKVPAGTKELSLDAMLPKGPGRVEVNVGGVGVTHVELTPQ